MSEQNTDPIDDNILEEQAEDLEPDVVDESDSDTTQSEEVEEEVVASTPSSEELDVDAALAAVSQLTLLTREDMEEDIEDSANEPMQSEDEAEEEHIVVHDVDFDQPRDLSMTRGQLASVIPALTLIILGGWLTFALTTSATPPDFGLIFATVLIGTGAVFLSQWLTSARWSRGNFFFGMSTLLIGGIQLYLSRVNTAAMSDGWAMWIVAIGIALFGAGYVTIPRLPRLSIMGFLTMVAGGIGYVLTSGIIDPTVIGYINNLWFVGAAIVVFMIFAPLIRRRQ